ncbi:MAG: type II toxin-antitoxin system RelE/ParE family toxin [Gammaproteobacteria bacterium]
MRSLKILITGPAQADLHEIYAYIAAENEEAAEMVIDRLYDAFDMVSKFPSIGVRSKSRRRRIVYRMKYAVYYQPDLIEDAVHILRVIHTARDRSSY